MTPIQDTLERWACEPKPRAPFKPRWRGGFAVLASLIAATMTMGFAPGARAASLTSPDDWAMYHYGAAHHGVSPETAIGATSASLLTEAWNHNLGYPAASSPAVVFNTGLGVGLVYAADEHGHMNALNAATGATIWSFTTPKIAGLSQHINSSPAVYQGVVYFGSNDHKLWALDATTGRLDCSFDTGGLIDSSPVVAEPDSTGPVVYFGDEGVSGGASDGGHIWAVNGVGNTNGACTQKWVFDNFGSPPGSQTGKSGSYSSPAYGTDAMGHNVVVFGTTDPDDSVYSVDAVTGTAYWRFQTKITPDSDVGAAPTISSPGNNGLTDGAVYITGKDKSTYAIDLTTGAQIWVFNLRQDDPIPSLQTTSGAALDGPNIYLGSGVGVYALNAVTGAKVWRFSTPVTNGLPAAVFGGPAISGGNGNKVVLFGDLGGTVRALRLSDGVQLWSFTSPVSGAAFDSSVAVSNNKAFILGTDGFAYAFSVPGTA